MRHFESQDKSSVDEWCGKWGVASPASFPELGYIEEGVAAGFLVKAECGTCFLEGFVTNPDASKESKGDAKIEIARKLIQDAKKAGFRKVFVITDDDVMKYIAATQFDFKEKPAKFLSKDL